MTESYFSIGTYVMSTWRNDFEYLAEVLAHRQRQGNKLEYRLRYIWDHVVEWTPVTRLRKATQFEVDYVFKFCKEHNMLGFDKVALKFETTRSDDLQTSFETDGTLSRSKRLRTAPVDAKVDKQVESKMDSSFRSRSVRNSSGIVHVDEKKINNVAPVVDCSIEQDEMVYDKSIIQFSEACRRRRQLKRQAIEAEVKDQSLKQSPIDSSRTCYSLDQNTSIKLLKMDQDLSTSETKHITPQTKHNGIIMKLDDQEILSNDSNDNLPLNQKQPMHMISNVIDIKSSKPHLSSPVTVLNSNPVDLITPLKSTPPVIFPCPHCPRRLRNSKLLNTHLRNYHKSVPVGIKSLTFKKSEVDWKMSLSKGIDSTEYACKQENVIDSDILSTHNKNKYLLTCHRCDLNTTVDQSHKDIIQCNHCLRWFHSSCYGLPSFGDSKNNTTKSKLNLSYLIICDGCRMVSKSGRKSRRNEWKTSIWEALIPSQNHDIHLSDSNIINQKLFSKATAILDQAQRLHPLLVTGRNILNATILPTIDNPNKQQTYDYNQNPKIVKSCCTESVTSDMKVSDDQVNRLQNHNMYMYN